MKTNSLRTIATLATLLATTTLPATGQVLPGPDGPVEFIGLDQWSVRELFDAIQDVAPGRPFHACAAVMKQELGFAEAAAGFVRGVAGCGHAGARQLPSWGHAGSPGGHGHRA